MTAPATHELMTEAADFFRIENDSECGIAAHTVALRELLVVFDYFLFVLL
jgi:hypothetical protein